MTGSKLSIFSHPGKIAGYWMTTNIYIIYLQINTWAFPYWPGYHPETPILALDYVSGQYWSTDDNQVNMEMPIVCDPYLLYLANKNILKLKIENQFNITGKKARKALQIYG
jgi:hypothetical protein